jgi:ABC-type sugar transport system substrate-binding protein
LNPVSSSFRHLIALTLVSLITAGAGCSKSSDHQSRRRRAERRKRSVKIGFYVSNRRSHGFNWSGNSREQAAKDLGFTLVKTGGNDGEKALAAIDTFAAGGPRFRHVHT